MFQVSLQDARRDRAVLATQEDIAAGAELCYDYRFAGDQRLPCNCGADTCRGFVNEPRSAGGEGPGGLLRVPESQLRPVKPSDFWHDV